MPRPVLEEMASFLELDVEATAATMPGAGVAQAAGDSSSNSISSSQRLAHHPFAMDVDSADGRPSSEREKGETIQSDNKAEKQRHTTAARATLSSTAATAAKGLVRTKNINAAVISEQQQRQQQHAPAGAGNSEPDGRPLGALGARPTSAPGASSDEALFPRPLARAQSLSRPPTAMGNGITGASRRDMMEGQGLAAGGAEGGGGKLERVQGQGEEYEEEEEEEEDQGEAELIWTFGQDEDDWSSGGEVVLDSILTNMMVVSAWVLSTCMHAYIRLAKLRTLWPLLCCMFVA